MFPFLFFSQGLRSRTRQGNHTLFLLLKHRVARRRFFVMNNPLANNSSVSDGLGIFRSTLRVNGSRKLGIRLTLNQAHFHINLYEFFTNTYRSFSHHIFNITLSRGLKSDSTLAGITCSMRCRNAFTSGLKETWRIGYENNT